MSGDFNRNVFVNCPFDDEYRQLLVGIAFTIIYFGYKPRLALERADSAESRIDKILGLINESKFGIHDLSRLVATEKDEHASIDDVQISEVIYHMEVWCLERRAG